jgi:pSer/pThr/pTyr-binding forkhead associated (FHA) protein
MKKRKSNQQDSESTILDPAAANKLQQKGLLSSDVGIYLQVVEGEDSGRRFDLSTGGVFTIGRQGCDINLEDRKVSRKHAEIQVLARDQYFVIDHASRNGTWVNGVRLNRRRLKHNDIIKIGDSPMQITVVESPIKPGDPETN